MTFHTVPCLFGPTSARLDRDSPMLFCWKNMLDALGAGLLTSRGLWRPNTSRDVRPRLRAQSGNQSDWEVPE